MPEPLPILIHLGLPAVLDLGLLGGLLHGGPHVGLYPLASAEDLALQVEAATLLGVVDVEELLEPVHDLLHVDLPALRRLDVQDLARLVQCHAACEARARPAAGGVRIDLGLRPRVVRRRLGLLVGFCEGPAQHPGTDHEGLE